MDETLTNFPVHVGEAETAHTTSCSKACDAPLACERIPLVGVHSNLSYCAFSEDSLSIDFIWENVGLMIIDFIPDVGQSMFPSSLLDSIALT